MFVIEGAFQNVHRVETATDLSLLYIIMSAVSELPLKDFQVEVLIRAFRYLELVLFTDKTNPASSPKSTRKLKSEIES